MLDTKPEKKPGMAAPSWDEGSKEESTPCLIYGESAMAPGRVTTPQGDLRFLNVRGSLPSMVRQLGARTSSEARKSAIPFFAGYLEQTLKNSPIHHARGVMQWATHQWVSRRLRSNMPREFARAIEAYAEGAGVDLEQLYAAYMMPETFLWLLGTFHKVLGTNRARGLGAPPMCGCTSAIYVDPVTNAPLHGRNFDYFGVDYWDQFATVVFYHPDDGLDYVSVSSVGFIGGGVTAMNAAGLTLVVHQHFVDHFDLDGVPVGVAGDEVMRRAHTIEEAVAILRDFPPVAGWTYVMTEGDTGRAAIYEVAPGKENLHFIQQGQRSLGYANVYWGEQFEPTEVDYYPEYRRCNYGRQARVVRTLNDLIAEQKEVGPRDIAQILADVADPVTGKTRLFGPTIANVLTVASVVFDPRRRRVWVGAGRSPTSRRWFIPFTLGLDERTGEGGPDLRVKPFTVAQGWEDSLHGRAFDLYRHATHLFYDGESDERLLIMIEYALALYPEEPNLHVLAGLLAMRIGRGKRAEGAFRRALEQLDEPARCAEVSLYLAWALDLQKQRTAAKHIYAKIAADPKADQVTRARGKQGRWKRFSDGQAARLALDFVYAGVP